MREGNKKWKGEEEEGEGVEILGRRGKIGMEI